jgi:prophage regulatory protein
MAEQEQQPPRVLRRREVERRVGHSRSTLYGWIAAGEFPRPVRIGARTVAWVESEISDWLRARVAESRGAK